MPVSVDTYVSPIYLSEEPMHGYTKEVLLNTIHDVQVDMPFRTQRLPAVLRRVLESKTGPAYSEVLAAEGIALIGLRRATMIGEPEGVMMVEQAEDRGKLVLDLWTRPEGDPKPVGICRVSHSDFCDYQASTVEHGFGLIAELGIFPELNDDTVIVPRDVQYAASDVPFQFGDMDKRTKIIRSPRLTPFQRDEGIKALGILSAQAGTSTDSGVIS